MHISEEQREGQIRALPIRDVAKQLLLGKLDLGPFNEYFQFPSVFYAQGAPDHPANWPPLQSRVLLPLWQHWDLTYVLDISSDPPAVLRFFQETADDAECVGSIDAAIFDMIELHVWEFGGGTAEVSEAAAFAELIQLPHRPHLSVLLDDHLNCTEETIGAYRHKLTPP